MLCASLLFFSVGCLATRYLHSARPARWLCPCEADRGCACSATRPARCWRRAAPRRQWPLFDMLNQAPPTCRIFYSYCFISVAPLELCILIFDVWNLSWFKYYPREFSTPGNGTEWQIVPVFPRWSTEWEVLQQLGTGIQFLWERCFFTYGLHPSSQCIGMPSIWAQLQCLFSGKLEGISSYKELVHREIMGCCSVRSWAPNVSLDKEPRIVFACHWEVSGTEPVNANLAEKQLLSDVRLLSMVWR